MTARLAPVLAVLVTVACGGPGSFEGTVAGYELDVESAVFTEGRNDKTGEIMAAILILSDVPDLCDRLKAGRDSRGQTSVTFMLFQEVGVGPSRAFVTPGPATYTIISSDDSRPYSSAIGEFEKTDVVCEDLLDSSAGRARSGLVTVEELEFGDDGEMRGVFDVTFGEQLDHTTGSFRAEYCAYNFANDLSCE